MNVHLFRTFWSWAVVSLLLNKNENKTFGSFQFPYFLFIFSFHLFSVLLPFLLSCSLFLSLFLPFPFFLLICLPFSLSFSFLFPWKISVHCGVKWFFSIQQFHPGWDFPTPKSLGKIQFFQYLIHWNRQRNFNN